MLALACMAGCATGNNAPGPTPNREPTGAPSDSAAAPAPSPAPSVTPAASTAAAAPKPAPKPSPTPLPRELVYLADVAPGIQVQLRYATKDNFTGRVVDGYGSTSAAIMTRAAAQALARVQKSLRKHGLGLLVYDAYRPKRAVAFFVAWSKNPDTSTKREYYPKYAKSTLFALGFIAKNSSHSQGHAVDLTLVDLASNQPLDMGSPFDLFDPVSHPNATNITKAQQLNRRLLANAMAAESFRPLSTEWWHFAYKVAGSRSYDFPIR